MDRQPLPHRSPCQDLGLSGYFNYDGEDNYWNSVNSTRNIYVVSHSENSDSRLIPTAVASSSSSSPAISTSSLSSSSLSIQSKKRKSSSLSSSSSSSSSSLSTFLSEGDDDLSSFLLSLSDRTGLRMHVDPLRCEDIEGDYHRSLSFQQPVVFLDNKDQEQDRNRVQEDLVGSIPNLSPTTLSRKRNQEEDHKVVEQNMTLADRILMMHRNNDALDTKESLLKSCTDPNPAARNKRQCLQ